MRFFFISIFLLFCLSHSAFAQGWTELGTGTNALNANNTIPSICSDKNGNIYAAVSFIDSVTDTSGIQYVAKWDGIKWNRLGMGSNALIISGATFSICTDTAGNLYAAGYYTDTSGKYYVAKWDPITALWSELGTGANALNANRAITSICSDISGNIYAGGLFTDTSRINYVAKWDHAGGSWGRLGTGTHELDSPGNILALCTDPENNVYAAAQHDYRTGYNVMKWNGTDWNELGSGTYALNAPYTILSLCVDRNANVYTSFGSLHNNYVAKWDAVSLAWSELGGSTNRINYAIFAIISDYKNNIYAAGGFTDSNGKSYAAKWDGTSWNELGTGDSALNANCGIYTLCMDPGGNLYAAGCFSDSAMEAQGHPYVAKWGNAAALQISGTQYENDSIKVYPNPANNTIMVCINTVLVGSDFSIFNSTGRKVYSDRFQKNNTVVDLSKYSPGEYLLKVEKSGKDFIIIKN